MNLPTASSLERAIKCPASCCLPQIRSQGGKAANKGTAVHKFLERCLYIGRDAALEEVSAEFQPLCRQIDVDVLLPRGMKFMAEVGYAMDVYNQTARMLGEGGNRDYSTVKENELCGTADLVAVWEDQVYIRDFKTGAGFVAPASTNQQLRFFALAAALAHGKKNAVVEIVKILHNGEIACDPAEFDAGDLARIMIELQEMLSNLSNTQELVNNGSQPPLSEGNWCQYCPAFEQCPAKTALIGSFLGGKFSAETADEDLLEVYRRVRSLEKLAKKGLERAKEMVEATCEGGLLDLGNGYVYGEAPDGKWREHRPVGSTGGSR